jgi:hypothetical protein
MRAEAKKREAETGINPLTEAFRKFFGPPLYFTDDGRRCCDDCRLPEAGPMLRNDLWATIAETTYMFLCFDCIEKRLGRRLTQGHLTVCSFNAGWINFDGADVAAMQFARGRTVAARGRRP